MCGAVVPRRSGPGRPPRYCSDGHRRVAEYQLRRAHTLLARAEKKAQDSRLAVLQASGYSRGRAEQTSQFWTDEVERLRGELDALLVGDGGPRAGAASPKIETKPVI